MKGHFLPNGDIQLDDGTTILKPLVDAEAIALELKRLADLQPISSLINLGDGHANRSH